MKKFYFVYLTTNLINGKCYIGEHSTNDLECSKERKQTTETRNKRSKSMLGKKHILKEVKCPYCSLIGKGSNMSKYHFEKCKQYDYEIRN